MWVFSVAPATASSFISLWCNLFYKSVLTFNSQGVGNFHAMDTITISQIAAWAALAVGLITSITFLGTRIKRWIQLAMRDEIKALDERLVNVELNVAKNFLVAVLDEVENGNEVSEIAKLHFWEQYHRYQDRGGNGYIAARLDKARDKL